MDLMGGVDSRGSYVSKILYVETKESGPLGGCAPGTPPRSANDNQLFTKKYFGLHACYSQGFQAENGAGNFMGMYAKFLIKS